MSTSDFRESDVSRAILDSYNAKFSAALESDVAIVGAGPSGLVAAWRLAQAKRRVVVLEKRLSPGGGIWGGALGMNEVVVQRQALGLLDQLGVRHRPSGGLFTADAMELASALCLNAVRAGAILLNLMSAEDVCVRDGRLRGVVANRSMLGEALPIDPIVFTVGAAIDATGHEAVLARCLQRRGLLKDCPGGLPGEGPMDAPAGERFVVDAVAEIYPGLWTTGMSVCASRGRSEDGAHLRRHAAVRGPRCRAGCRLRFRKPMRCTMSFVFGPVPSRRLGRSLGVDLVPFKTCSYDCIYCQLGRTTDKTVERREWVPLDPVLSELEDKLSTRPDYITLSGSGEPTLFSRLDELIEGIRGMTDIPIAVLTNGSLLWREEVRAQLMAADLVIPSLDAGEAGMFQAVNRPHESLSFDRMLDGLIAFREAFRGEYWLEVFLLAGHTGIESAVRQIADCVRRIRPDWVQLNTATRPTAEDYAVMVDRERMEQLARQFDPPAEVIADYRGVHGQSEFRAGRRSVLEMIQRRPCSLDDIADGLGMHRNEAIKYVEELDAEGLLTRQSSGGKLFYAGKHSIPDSKT